MCVFTTHMNVTQFIECGLSHWFLCIYMRMKRFFYCLLLLLLSLDSTIFVCSAIKKLRILISKAFSYISHLNCISNFFFLHKFYTFTQPFFCRKLKMTEFHDDDQYVFMCWLCFVNVLLILVKKRRPELFLTHFSLNV